MPSKNSSMMSSSEIKTKLKFKKLIYGDYKSLVSITSDFNHSKYIHFTAIDRVNVILCSLTLTDFNRYLRSLDYPIDVLFLDNDLDFTLIDYSTKHNIFFLQQPRFRFSNLDFDVIDGELRSSLKEFLRIDNIDAEEHESYTPSIVLVGPTNVGKSTLVNTLLSHKVSLVKDELFTTKGLIRVENMLNFTVVDSEGFVKSNYAEMTKHYSNELDDTDLIVLVTDVHNYHTSVMRSIVGWAQKTKKNFCILCNKADLIDKEKQEDIREALLPMLVNNDLIFTSALYSDKIDSLRAFFYKFLYKSEIVYSPTNYLTRLVSQYDAILYVKQLKQHEIDKRTIRYSYLFRIKRNKDIALPHLKHIRRIISKTLNIRNYYIQITLCR